MDVLLIFVSPKKGTILNRATILCTVNYVNYFWSKSVQSLLCKSTL